MEAMSDLTRGRLQLIDHKRRPSAQVLLQKTVWREAEVGDHICNRRKLLAALHPDPAAASGAVFCWETVLKVRSCRMLRGDVLQLRGECRSAGSAPVTFQR